MYRHQGARGARRVVLQALPMLVLISAAPSLFPRAPFTARRVFIGSGPATGRSKVLAGLQPRLRPVAMADSFVDDEVEMMGQKVVARRFVEAAVGMTFPKKPLHDELFAREWPEKYPFPPEAFKRQDEQDDSDFYSTPRLVYHIDEGAVRSLTNYYKENIAAGSSVLDICSSWVPHYPAIRVNPHPHPHPHPHPNPNPTRTLTRCHTTPPTSPRRWSAFRPRG